MKSFWSETKQGRFLVVSVVTVAYIVLLVADGLRFFPPNETNALSFGEQCLRFGFSALVAVLFLAVGGFTWLYARDRRVATLLFIFTIASMSAITVQTAALQGDALLSAIGGVSSAISLLPLFALLLIFPKKSLSPQHEERRYQEQTRGRIRIMRVFLVVLSLLSSMSVVDYAYRYVQPGHVPPWLEVAGNIYFPLMLLIILATIPLSYFRSSSLRERQRVRFFLGGVLLAFAPLLILTVLPVVTAHSEYAVDGQISSLFYFVLPLSIGYGVLRPQVLIYDSAISRTVTWIGGIISTGVLGYMTVVGIGIALANHLSFSVLYGGVGFALVLSPCLWWLTSFGTERFLFQGERAGYSQYLRTVTQPIDQKFDLEHVAELLVTAAQRIFETEETCLFVSSMDTPLYFLYPLLGETSNNVARQTFLERLYPVLEMQEERSSGYQLKQMTIQHLVSTQRPLLLNDITDENKESFGRVSHYLNTSPSYEGGDVLFAPIWARGEMIAVLVLGKRADQQPYGGPDFDIVQLLLTQFSSVLETARVTEELRVAYERQKELDALKDQFIMTASHELRTPLTAVLGYIELLEEYNETLSVARRANFISKAHRGCDELTLMVNNIMDANRVQADVDTLQLTAVSLQESVLHIVEIVESLLKLERHTISLVLPPAPLFVMADAVRLRQVLLNLVSNAIKYSPPSAPIELSVHVVTECATICVRDYGLGVPPAEHTRLFERFVRLERDMNSPTRGTGLGLYICRRLIQAMHGTIWMESTGIEGEGSRFVFTLPLAPLSQIPSSRSDQLALGHE